MAWRIDPRLADRSSDTGDRSEVQIDRGIWADRSGGQNLEYFIWDLNWTLVIGILIIRLRAIIRLIDWIFYRVENGFIKVVHIFIRIFSGWDIVGISGWHLAFELDL